MTDNVPTNSGNQLESVEDSGILSGVDVSGISAGNTPSPLQPSNPKVTEFKETAPGSGHWFARSGGPFKNDWSGIDEEYNADEVI